MKPLFMLIVVVCSIFNLAHAQTATIVAPPSAVNSFQKTFKDAVDVEWSSTSGLFKAKFMYGNQLMYAFYNELGERVCIGRNISMQQIPPTLQTSFQNKFPESNIREVFEIAGEGGISYYITITRNNKKVILKSLGMEHWSIYSKEKEVIKYNQ